MTPYELAERCFEIPARVERIVHLATVGGDDMDSDMFEWLTEDAMHAMEGAFGVDDLWPHLNECGENVAAQREMLAQAMVHRPVLGWLVQVSTPVKTPSGSGYRYSWGVSTSKVFYADTYEEALEAGLTWADTHPVVSPAAALLSDALDQARQGYPVDVDDLADELQGGS